MALTVKYYGPLPPAGNRQDKHHIRKQIHPWLKELWNDPPMDLYRMKGEQRKISGFSFQPAISLLSGASCELNIKLLTRDPSGRIIQGGDLDNRLKTLFDALRVPQHEHEIPPDEKPTDNEHPFYGLLEDDSLITLCCIRSEKLLSPKMENEDNFYVELDIEVAIRYSHQI